MRLYRVNLDLDIPSRLPISRHWEAVIAESAEGTLRLASLQFRDSPLGAEKKSALARQFGPADELPLGSVRPRDFVERLRLQLEEYFRGERRCFEIPLLLSGTAFQERSWRALLDILYGQTVSYEQQAAVCGDRKLARAVGGANRANKILILLPCHRVIGKDGQIRGYAGLPHYKEALLTWEKENLG